MKKTEQLLSFEIVPSKKTKLIEIMTVIVLHYVRAKNIEL